MIYTVAELFAGLALTSIGVIRANEHSRGTAAILRAEAVLMVVVGGMLFLGAVQTFLPVAGHLTARVVTRSPGEVVLSMHGVKERECKFLGVTGQAIGEDGTRSKAAIDWPGDPVPGSNRGLGWQDFGLWRYRFDSSAEPVVAVESTATHDCGRLWPQVKTPQGPFKATP